MTKKTNLEISEILRDVSEKWGLRVMKHGAMQDLHLTIYDDYNDLANCLMHYVEKYDQYSIIYLNIFNAYPTKAKQIAMLLEELEEAMNAKGEQK